MVRRVRKWRLVETTERGKVRQRLVYTREVLWQKVSKVPVLLVFSRDPEGKERDDFFFTTDCSLTGVQAIEGFCGRWSVEDTFRNTKQFVGGEEPQTWTGEGPERAVMLSLWLGSVVWLWFLQQPAKRHKVAGPPLVSGQDPSEFPRCLGGVAAASVGPTNKRVVRPIVRTSQKTRDPHRSPIQGRIDPLRQCESPLITAVNPFRQKWEAGPRTARTGFSSQTGRQTGADRPVVVWRLWGEGVNGVRRHCGGTGTALVIQ
jgi:hypothetical protein